MKSAIPQTCKDTIGGSKRILLFTLTAYANVLEKFIVPCSYWITFIYELTSFHTPIKTKMICFGYFQLVIHSIGLMLIFAKENRPFDRTVKCDSEGDTFSKTYTLISYVESNGIQRQCRSDEDHLKAKLYLRPNGDGTHCTTFEFAFRHELPSIFQKTPCHLPYSFDAPVTNEDLWEVTYLCGTINGKGNGGSEPIPTRDDTKIIFNWKRPNFLYHLNTRPIFNFYVKRNWHLHFFWQRKAKVWDRRWVDWSERQKWMGLWNICHGTSGCSPPENRGTSASPGGVQFWTPRSSTWW